MPKRETLKTSLGDALRDAGVESPAEGITPVVDMPSSSEAIHGLYQILSSTQRLEVGYRHIALAVQAARGGQQVVLKAEHERRGAMAIIDATMERLGEHSSSSSAIDELVLGLLCWCTDSGLRKKISDGLLSCLKKGSIEKDALNPSSFDRKPRRLIQTFLKNTTLDADWNAEERRRRQLQLQQERDRRRQQRSASKERRKILRRARRLLAGLHESMTYIETNPVFKTPALGSDDLQLIAVWGNANYPGFSLEARDVREAFVDGYEFSRLYSARAAELAAQKYYSLRSKRVSDIAIIQLERACEDWKSHDLLVDSRPIDVKSARPNPVNPDRFSSYFVPQFKLARSSGRNVVITAVLNRPYRTDADILAGNSARSLILGEVKAADLSALGDWIKRDFNGLIDVSGMTADRRLPGWCFDYGWDQADRDHEIHENLCQLRQLLDENPWLSDRIHVPYAVSLRHRLSLLAGGKEDIASDDLEMTAKLQSMRESVGLTRRGMFLFILATTLAKLRAGDRKWSPRKLLSVFFWAEDREAILWPLGVYDPLKYVYEIIRGMDQLWSTSREYLQDFKAFRLASPSILVGIDSEGRQRTLMAYCGGWLEMPKSRMPCGNSPLILGNHEGCPRCGKLICSECGYCSDSCR